MTSLRPQVSVVIPAYGPVAPVLAAVDRLLEQSAAVHLDVIVVDNDPARGLPRMLPNAPRLRLVEPGFNSGFAGAINRGIAASMGEFVLFHNADLLLEDGYLPEVLAFMRQHPNAGAAAGKTIRPPDGAPGGSHRIDSAGIVMRRDRSAFDRGEGDIDEGQFEAEEEVFAVSGAALVARRAALEDVAVGDEYLADDFFMYKDDLDLCWRMRQRGWECWYVPSAVAVHVRSGRGMGDQGYLRGFRAYLRNQRRKPAHIRIHSLKNEILMLVRNESPSSLADAPRILARQAAVIFVTAVTAPALLARSLALLGQSLPGAWRDRRTIRGRRIVPPGEIRARWFRG